MDTTVSTLGFLMAELTLLSSADTQKALGLWVQTQRKAAGLSRAALAVKSTVPAATIKKFETTGQISLRQFTLLWQSVDDLKRLHKLTLPSPVAPTSIKDVLAQ